MALRRRMSGSSAPATRSGSTSSDTQQIFIFRPGEERSKKKAIEEGPLPFLFNMRRR